MKKKIKVTLQHLFHGSFRIVQITNATEVEANAKTFGIGVLIERSEDAKALCSDTRYEVVVNALKD